MPELDFFFDDVATEAPVTDRPRSGRASSSLLAELALGEALRPHRSRILREPSFGLVVECPTAGWVDPVRHACGKLRHWDAAYARDGSSRFDDKPEKGSKDAAVELARGGYVLGVSQAPQRYLPSSLMVSADLVVAVPAPTKRLVASLIRKVTGRTATDLPDGVGALDYDEICAAVRSGTSPKSCAARLAAALKAKAVTDPGVTEATPFEELAGYGEDVRTWGTQLIAAVEQWRRGLIPLSAVAPRRVVFSGPPGTGKTTLARSVAKSTKLKLVSSSVAGWFSASAGDLGAVIRAVDKVVADTLAAAPCVLLLDELDALPARAGLSSREASWWTPVVTHVLLTLDALMLQDKALVCIIGATNHGERLDAALTRPGRLERIVEISPPDEGALAIILRQHLGTDLPDADLRPVARMGAGATGATAVGWVVQARSRASLEDRNMRLSDLLDAVAPPERRSPEVLRRIALHEASHAVASEELGCGHVETVSLVSRGYGGHVDRRLTTDQVMTLERLRSYVVTILAGRAAETVLLGAPSAGAGGTANSDLGRATYVVASIHSELGLGRRLSFQALGGDPSETLKLDRELAAAVERDLASLFEEAEAFVREHRELIEAVADRLLAERMLDGDDLRSILAARKSPPKPGRGATRSERGVLPP